MLRWVLPRGKDRIFDGSYPHNLSPSACGQKVQLDWSHVGSLGQSWGKQSNRCVDWCP